MGLNAFPEFNALYKAGHQLRSMGLTGKAGDVTRLTYRMKLAKSFRGIDAPGIAERTIQGYNGLLHVFLTHSALEQYLSITNQKLNDIEAAVTSLGSTQVMKEVFDADD